MRDELKTKKQFMKELHELRGRVTELEGVEVRRGQAEEALRESEKQFKELWDNAPVAYHILDTKGFVINVNQTEAKMLGYTREEMAGKSIFEFILPEQQAKAQKRFQLKMLGQSVPKADGRIYVKKDGARIYVDIDDVVERDSDGKIIGVRTTMVDITERKMAEEELNYTLEMLHKSLGATIQAINRLVEMRDPYTAGHQRRVADLARAIATEMGLSQEQVNGIRMAGSIHDIGKISVPGEILSKPGRLEETEFNLIKIHPKYAYEILKPIKFPGPVAQAILQHHERIDGSGYPVGLKDKEILVEAKILAVADVVEAMVSHRPYRAAHSLEHALKEISKNSGVLYDPKVVEACLNLFAEKGFIFREDGNATISPN